MSPVRLAIALLVLVTSFSVGWHKPTSAQSIVWDGSEPAPGTFFYWYLPSFYVGFAPRTQDPSRAHMQLSRGNQVRFTIVLAEEQIDSYLADLQLRRETYEELIARNVISLATNAEYERFLGALDSAGVAETIAQRASLSPEDYRERSLEVMRELNPGRIFDIRIDARRAITNWHATLSGLTDEDLSDPAKQLDAANALLRGRINLIGFDEALAAEFRTAVSSARDNAASDPAFQERAASFLESATTGHYAVRDETIEATEFTAIYPVGTIRAFKDTPYGRLPEFGVTGVWRLMPRSKGRGQTGMVDYLSSNPGYGFIPLLAYQHAGGVYYNALHNAGVRSPMDLAHLPAEWKAVPGERTPERTYTQLWLVSRGPASHGCTRMDSGQMSELRNSLPSDSAAMEGIPVYRNLPRCYEVFDIDGDGTEEVMGVQYYVAYDSKKHLPTKAYAPNNRSEYYEWLYGENIRYEADGTAVIKKVPTCRFVGERKAEEAVVYEDVPLYEAPFEPGRIQFYELLATPFETAKGFEFNRGLRRVGVGYDHDRAALFLE